MLPNFLIVGAQKAGTTSLWSYLRVHPDVFMPQRKELNFFFEDDWRGRLDWYHAQFEGATAKAVGEASPTYSFHPWPKKHSVADAIGEVLPGAKLIYMVRDPVERALSAWVQHTAVGLEKRPLSEAMTDLHDPYNLYVPPSSYTQQLEQYLKHFPMDRIYVEDSTRLRHNRQQTLAEIFEFLGVDPSFSARSFDAEMNTAERQMGNTELAIRVAKLHPVVALRRSQHPTALRLRDAGRKLLMRRVEQRPVVDPALRERLADALRADASAFRELTGKPFASWSV